MNVSGDFTVSIGFTTNMLPWSFFENSKFFYRKADIFLKKPKSLTLKVLRYLIISVAFYSKFATLCSFEKVNFLDKTICFFKNPNFERFQKSYNLSRILRQVCYMLIIKTLKHVINQRWLVYASSLGKHGAKTGIDLRRIFCFQYLKYGAKWSQWEMWVLQVFVMKTSIWLFSSNEHEMNPNKRRRQLQSPVLGILFFLWIKFLDFWFLLPRSWEIFLAKFARYCKFFQDRGKRNQENCWGSFRTSKNKQYFRKRSKRVLHESNTRLF